MSKEKKQTLQKILTAVIPYWNQAEGFLLLLNEEGNNELIEKLYQEILENIRKIESETKQKQIKKVLQKLKQKEETTTKADEDEAEEMLNDFINNI